MNLGESMKDKISIIIPAYNVEEYLEKCLESIISQNFDKVEIIIVDDGSTDPVSYTHLTLPTT